MTLWEEAKSQVHCFLGFVFYYAHGPIDRVLCHHRSNDRPHPHSAVDPWQRVVMCTQGWGGCIFDGEDSLCLADTIQMQSILNRQLRRGK